jgi:hypothetical protein
MGERIKVRVSIVSITPHPTLLPQGEKGINAREESDSDSQLVES